MVVTYGWPAGAERRPTNSSINSYVLAFQFLKGLWSAIAFRPNLARNGRDKNIRFLKARERIEHLRGIL